MSEVEIITMSPLTLLMKKQRQKTYSLNQVHCPWTVADPGLENPSHLERHSRPGLLEEKAHWENAQHSIDLWPLSLGNFYLEVCLREYDHPKYPSYIIISQWNDSSVLARSPLHDDTIILIRDLQLSSSASQIEFPMVVITQVYTFVQIYQFGIKMGTPYCI